MKISILASSAMLLAAGCQSTGEGALTGAVIGAAGGAIAGEIFAGSPGRGAAYGALIGAAVGAYEGCSRAGTCWGRARDNGQRRYDRYSGRYYYVDPEYGDTYWEDGSFREYSDDYRPQRRGRH
jgi:YMGG-like Gly-zipper